MSSRVLRKLHGDGDEIAKEKNEGSDPESELASSGGAKKKQNVNRYDLFNQLSQSESEVKEDDDDDNEPEISGTIGVASTDRTEGDLTRRKKKKKKKKSIKISSSNQKSSEDNAEVDEVERSVREVNKILGETWTARPSTSSGDGTTLSKKGILNIEQRFLNPNNELKRIFGSKIVQNEISKRRARGRGHVKSMWLVSPRENWAKVGKQGISMRLVEIVDGAQYFTFEHNAAYQHVQMVFLRAVDTLNPDNIVAIINGHPYHVDALLQLSDMCKMSEDLQMAAELNERVLFCLETAFHPSFNFALGTCRLDYRRQENRALFIALFKHLMFVGQRACYRTALEFCKLLLSLDPAEDPMAVVLCIDFYALKAGEYAWLLKAGQEWETNKNIVQLPNFAYSLAVAQFYLSEEGNTDAADEMLQNALIMFPSVLVPLLEKCSIQPDPKVTAHPFFNVLTNPRERPALVQLVQLYIARSHHVWKDAALLPWLERNVARTLERVDAADPLVDDARDKRAKRYRKPPRAVVRHILLSDLKDVTATLEENTEEAVLSYDPLPPLDSINLYTPPVRSRLHDNDGLFSVFFRSILPSFNVNEPAPVDGQQPRPRREEWVEDGGAVGPVADFQRSVVSLVDAVRDLLSNINVRPADGAADADHEDQDDESSEDDPDLDNV